MSRRRIIGVSACVLAAVVLALPAAGQEPLPAMGATSEAEFDAADVNSGRFDAMGGIFGNQRIDCLRCHGLDGAGDPSGAFPRLAGQGAWYLYKTLHDFAEGRRRHEVMTPVARSLTDEEMRAVSAYYASLPPASAVPPRESDPAVMQTGGALAAIGSVTDGIPACSGCHGDAGQGRPPVVPSLAAQSAPYLAHQLLLWKAGERESDPMGVMEAIAGAMSEEQIHAVALYYSALPPVVIGAPAAEVQPLTPQEEIGRLRPPYLRPPAASEEAQ